MRFQRLGTRFDHIDLLAQHLANAIFPFEQLIGSCDVVGTFSHHCGIIDTIDQLVSFAAENRNHGSNGSRLPIQKLIDPHTA